MDGDGYGDVVIGATTECFFHESGVDNANLGGPVNAAGDVDADGYDDVVAGATALDTDEVPGALYAYEGGAAGPTALSWENHGDADGYGWSAGGVGDVDGDGYADVASASPFAGAGTAIRKPLGGCGCATGTAPTGGLAGLLVGLVGLGRARRNREDRQAAG